MGKNELSKRKNWQTNSQEKSEKAEKTIFDIIKGFFENNDKYDAIYHPNDLNQIYNNVKLDNELQNKIYKPENYEKVKHGIKPDYSIISKTSGKKIYIELKRQDGWVENKPKSAGRGNAHERGCKYFAPGLLKVLRNETKIIDDNVLPFATLYCGDIARDPNRVREITLWFDKFKSNYFFWMDFDDKDSLKKWIFKKILPIIDK